jgi:SAM-dependent methyltransferase
LSHSETQSFWDDLYRSRDRVWSGRANPVLVTLVDSMTPATALDLGCGEGGDAVWLAGRGWRVTATDVSEVALARGRAAAKAAGLDDRIDWQEHDLSKTFPSGSFELVSAQFLQSPIEFARESVLQAAAAAVSPGGLLLIVSHAAHPPWALSHNHDVHFPSPQETVEGLELAPGEWRVDRAEVAERQATGPDGTVGMLSDCIVAVSRLR